MMISSKGFPAINPVLGCGFAPGNNLEGLREWACECYGAVKSISDRLIGPGPDLSCAPCLLSSAADRSEHGLTDALSDSRANAGIGEEAFQSERRNGEHIRDLGGAIIGRTAVFCSTH